MQMFQAKRHKNWFHMTDVSRKATLVCASQALYNIKCQKPSASQRSGLNADRGVRRVHRAVNLKSCSQWITVRANYFCCYTFTSSNSSPNINTLITPVMTKEAYWCRQTHLIAIQKHLRDCQRHTHNLKCYIKYRWAYISAPAWFYIQL